MRCPVPLGISPVFVTLVGRSSLPTPARAIGRDPVLRNLLNHCHYVLEKKATAGSQVWYCRGWGPQLPRKRGQRVCAAGQHGPEKGSFFPGRSKMVRGASVVWACLALILAFFW